MARTGGDILIDAIQDWGVEVVFGMPGDGNNGIMEALRQRGDKVRFIQVRHEESAALMACAYAKYTGRLGCCLATSGPGGIHLLNGLYDAKLDGQPVLAITGHHFHDLIDTHAQQDINLDLVFKDVAVYSTRVMGPDHVHNVADLACRLALSRRGVAHINFPVDFQSQTSGERSARNVPGHTSDVPAFKGGCPAEDDLRRAAEVLNSGKKVAILAGRGTLGAADELEQLAEALAAPVIKALLGKACLTTVLTPPAASGFWAPSHPRRRSRAATRYSWSARHFRTSSSIPSRAAFGASNSTSTRCGSAYVTRSRWDWLATLGAPYKRSCPC
jgi:pyruvate dehydrogenase (quinone)